MAEEFGEGCGEEVELWVAVASGAGVCGVGQWGIGDAGYAEPCGWEGGYGAVK